MKSRWFLWFLSVAACGATAADIRFTEIASRADGIAITWTTDPGKTYRIESAPAVTGPWQNRVELNAAASSLSWSDQETGVGGARFYRVTSVVPLTASDESFVAADAAPLVASAFGIESANLSAQAVFLASTLTGGSQLVTTGTLTQLGQNWTYSPAPSERLLVQFQAGTNMTFVVTRMEGDFSSDAATFLRNPHRFEYQATAPGIADLHFSSHIPSGTCNFQSAVSGSLQWRGVTYVLDLAMAGEYCTENGFGYFSLRNDYTTSGTVTAPGFALRVEERRRFELITTSRDSASSEENWNNNTLTIGADTYKWAGTKKQKSFKDGKPSSVDTYWQATGAVLKNGAPYGTYRRDASAAVGWIRFVLDLPDRTVELERWQAL